MLAMLGIVSGKVEVVLDWLRMVEMPDSLSPLHHRWTAANDCWESSHDLQW